MADEPEAERDTACVWLDRTLMRQAKVVANARGETIRAVIERHAAAGIRDEHRQVLREITADIGGEG